MSANSPPSRNGSAGSFPIEIVARATGLDQVTAQFTRFNEVLKLTGATIAQQMNNIRNLGTSLNTFTQSTTRVNQTLDQYMNTTRNAVTATTAMTNAVKNEQSTFQQVSTALGQASLQMGTLAASAEKSAIALKTDAAAEQAFTNEVKNSTMAIEQNAAATNLDTEAKQRNIEKIVTQARHISGLVLSVAMLTNILSDSQMVQDNIAAQKEKIAEDQDKLNKAIQQYGKDSHQAIQAADALHKAQRGLGFEQREATAQMHNMAFVVIMLGVEIMGSLLPALLNWEETSKKLQAAIPRLSTALTNFAERMRFATVATIEGETAGRSLLMTLGPIGIAIAVVGTVLALTATNTFGFRDAMQGAGKAVGDAVPILAPFLEGLQGIAAQLHLTGESADQAKIHMDNATRGFQNMGTIWNNVVSAMQHSSNKMVQELGKASSALSSDFVQAANDFSNQLKATTNTWNQFVNALGKGDYKKAVDLIINAFVSLPKIILTGLKDLDRIVEDAFRGLINTVGPVVIGVATELGSRLLTGLQQAWANLSNWVETYLAKPVIAGIQNIPNQLADLPKKIIDSILNYPKVINEVAAFATNIWNGITGTINSLAEGYTKLQKSQDNGLGRGHNITGGSVKPLDSRISLLDPNTLGGGTGNKSTIGDNFNQTVKGTVSSLGQQQAAITANTGTIVPYLGKIQEAVAATTNWKQSAVANTQVQTAQVPIIDQLIAEHTKAMSSDKGHAKSTDELTIAGLTYMKSLGQLNPAIANNKTALDEVGVSFGKVIQDTDKMAEEVHNNAAAWNAGYLQVALFNQGVTQQSQDLQNAQMQLAVTNGVLSEYVKQVQSGAQQQVAFTQGAQDILKEFLDMNVETAKLAGNYTALQLELQSTKAAQDEFNNGMMQGLVDTSKMIIEIDKERGAFVGTRVELEAAAAKFVDFGDKVRISNEALDQFVKVIHGSPEAIKSMIDSISQFSGEVISKVADAVKKGGDELKKAYKEIESDINRKLTKPEKKIIEVQADTQNAVNEIENNLSLAFDYAAQGSQKSFDEAIKGMLDTAQEQFDNTGGRIQSAWGEVMNNLQTLSKDGLNSPKLIQDAAALVLNLEKLGVSGDKAKLMLQGLGLTSQQADKAIAGASTSIAGTGTAAQTADPQLQKYFQTLSQFGNIETAAQTIFEQVIPSLIANVAVAMNNSFKQGTDDAIGYMKTLNDNTIEVFMRIVEGLDPVVQAFNDQFSTAQQNATDQMHTLSDNTIEVFMHIVEGLDPVLQAFDTTFSTAQQNETDQMRTMSDNIIEAFMRIVEGLDQVAQAFEDMSNRAQSALDSVRSSADSATSSVKQLANAINSLKNKTVTITTVYKTTGKKAGQFGLTATVDKPTEFLAGEGNSPERVKISPGTMPFVEDFKAEMNQFFRGKRADQGNGSNNQNSRVVSQGDIVGKGNNYNYQSDSGGSRDSHSTELHRDNYSMHKTRVLHETPLDIRIDIDGSTLAKKIIRLVTEELHNAGVYG